MNIDPEQKSHAQDLLDFIDLSPSPWHVAHVVAQRLEEAGYSMLNERDRWSLLAGGKYYVIRGGSSIIAFQVGSDSLSDSGFRIIGAHTDSPGLRIKPKGAHAGDKLIRLGVDVYGGPILATFSDRDLSLAGRLSIRAQGSISSRLIHFDSALVRLPNLAIHMNRTVNDEGLKFNKQTELALILGKEIDSQFSSDMFMQMLAERAECEPADILSFEMNVYDTQKGALWGASGEFLANSQIDNLSSCHAGLIALLNTSSQRHTVVCAFFDHEEVGSESHKGADGCFLPDVLERLALGRCDDGSGYKQALANSLMISADAAHAQHPNFPAAYEPLHGIKVNGGPAVKINVNQRYTTDGPTEALFKDLCRQAGAPCQTYVHRADLACGSTIGPMAAARLGLPAIDCGIPMWAMHSARESAGVLDQFWFAKVLQQFFGLEALL